MKNNINWKNSMPKETEEFHQKLCDVIQSLPEERTSISRKRYIPFFALVVFLLSSITVYAAIKWNDRAVDYFGANEKLQNNLTEEGYSNQEIQSVTYNGITVTLKQTIQDENLIYLLFTVASDNFKLTEDNAMSYDLKASGDTDFYTSISSGFVDQFIDPNISNSREYEILIQKKAAFDFKNTTLTCDFNALQEYTSKAGPEENLVMGKWNFNIDLKVNNSVTIDLNELVSIDGCNVLIYEIKISPLSYTLVCDGESVRELQKANNIDINELDSTYPLLISGIKYKDASIIYQTDRLMSEGFDKKSGNFIAKGKFSEAIDIEEVQGLIFGDMEASIFLK